MAVLLTLILFSYHEKLHLAAITSMKGEITELKSRLQHVSSERDLMERQLNMTQVKCWQAHFFENVFEDWSSQRRVEGGK